MPDATDHRTATADLEAVLASLAYLLTRSQEHERQAARAGITAARSDVYLLRALAEAEGASRVGDLAARLMVKPSHVTRQIDRLQSQQLVERTPDTADRRARQVELTAEGLATLDRLKRANIAGLTDALDGIPEPDVAATVTVLRHLVERYVHRVRTTVLPDDGPPPNRPASGAPSASGAAPASRPPAHH
ncbi:MarR family winged helix-turn-helix transcriptional regulator [Streptomyces sp. NRRL S-350]|uniref:MarR family winged helix-turn-helix transcriptional regulator n=1 Tax=Streptomyces sp. NRRL S-350 TaxID=1463902 RepID=UPI0007C5342F|nr:MarR family transcriptional regulator [Streptomyces sp. NRRL S-350]